jgi:hypothetical protein
LLSPWVSMIQLAARAWSHLGGRQPLLQIQQMIDAALDHGARAGHAVMIRTPSILYF